jgi:glycerophosphoryl diester phosphodiesterase
MRGTFYLVALLFGGSVFVSSGSAQMIVAHRGASFDAPENTLAAFTEAWKQQADGVEGDFYLTKDEQIVCIHDADTLRTGGTKRIVAESTLAELRELEYGAWKGEAFRGEPLPTFAEVLAAVPADKLFVIELKTGPEIVPFLKAELEKETAVDRKVLIIAFNDKTVAECKKQLPAIRVHWLTGYKQNKATGQWQPSPQDVAKRLQECHADGLGTQGNRQVVNAEFLSNLRSEGLKEFHVWTIDQPEDAIYFQSLGAVGITTNRPAFLRAELDSAELERTGK